MLLSVCGSVFVPNHKYSLHWLSRGGHMGGLRSWPKWTLAELSWIHPINCWSSPAHICTQWQQIAMHSAKHIIPSGLCWFFFLPVFSRDFNYWLPGRSKWSRNCQLKRTIFLPISWIIVLSAGPSTCPITPLLTTMVSVEGWLEWCYRSRESEVVSLSLHLHLTEESGSLGNPMHANMCGHSQRALTLGGQIRI